MTLHRQSLILTENCPIRDVLDRLGDRWTVLVLHELAGGTRRFTEVRKRIADISPRMLAQTLQWLEHDGMVHRVAFDVVPPHVEYSLTPLGREAAEKVRALADWIETSLPRIAEGWEKR